MRSWVLRIVCTGKREISDAIMQVEGLMSNGKGMADDLERLLKNRNKKNANCSELMAYISSHSSNQSNTNAVYLNAKTLEKLLSRPDSWIHNDFSPKQLVLISAIIISYNSQVRLPRYYLLTNWYEKAAFLGSDGAQGMDQAFLLTQKKCVRLLMIYN